MKKIVFFCVIIVLYSCSKRERFPTTHIIGHGGTGLKNINSIYHDNTQESVTMALETLGCDGVEIDIQLSKDNELWLFHDDYLNELTTGNDCISAHSYDYLKSVTYKTTKKEKLIRLKELNIQAKNKTILLDLRHYSFCNEALVDAQKFEEELLLFYNKVDPSISIQLIVKNLNWVKTFDLGKHSIIYEVSDLNKFYTFNNQFSLKGIAIRNDDITASEVKQLQNEGIEVHLFNIRAPKPTRKALRKKPDFIIVDDLRTAIIEKN
jgi:glycerophosphoryl diester phosphodiesterase